MEISRNFTTRKVSFDRAVSKISSQIPINRDWSRLTDRRVFPEESLVSTKIFLCAWRAVWPATGRFYWKRWISCSPSFDSPPFLPFSFRVFKINTIDLPLSSQLFVAQMFENIRVVKQIYGGIFTRAITRIIILSE